ncbi:NOB1 [Cyberlindnera jadinii]|uniref:20S-pre-rRNA D-site endonuclease NOB1 n=1 Tax=Cyberlindnera jadinii (strain ATCC 18201 / CBS 1600 / BCRC 20928 / JCM 3617 / NBRC 0987 / NRRL Y-1542) TaxID=983966 RepID=A0A0H5C3T6_CYBJN|nr:NOB1 [Cyberlindnera jadinii]
MPIGVEAVDIDSETMSEPRVLALVLDATPLITQHISTLKTFAKEFYTTPTVYNEIKDENAKKNLALWGEYLQVRHPKAEFIKKVTDFSKLTGDYAVLSANDIHIIALTYELECEFNHGDWRLRSFPGEKREFKRKVDALKEKTTVEAVADAPVEAEVDAVSPEQSIGSSEPTEKKKKPRRRGGKKNRERRLAREAAEAQEQAASQHEGEQNQKAKEETETSKVNAEEEVSQGAINDALDKLDEKNQAQQVQDLEETYEDDDDDGEWITSENMLDVLIRDSGEQIEKEKVSTKIKVALATGDFAVQNVSMQIGLNLMSTVSGLQIKRVRNYMMRCHACFTMVPIPKNGQPKHFCPRCGGQTLLRCAVSVDSKTGEVTPHLKANFEWHKRGDRYSLASPLSKNTQKRMGKKGFVHNKSNKQKEYEEPILREDQKEYQKALKDDDWLRRKNEKILDDYIGGGSADNFISPFVAQGFRAHGVKVGKGRYVNSGRRRK